MKRDIGAQTVARKDGSPATQNIEMIFIPEGDIYRLAAKSELPGAGRSEKEHRHILEAVRNLTAESSAMK